MNYYNEFDPEVAQWLRNLIAAGLVPDGDVDERSITEVKANELKGYTQCHFFAGIDGWPYALQLANWPANRPVWTGSCPCQPFSTAGKQKGKEDERHLWPVWFELIRESKPPVVFGEQVSAAIRHHWWDDVADDLEREGYTTRAEIRPASSVGAPHKRERLWFVADAKGERNSRAGGTSGTAVKRPKINNGVLVRGTGDVIDVGNTKHDGLHGGQVKGSYGEAIPDNAQRQDSSSELAGTGQSGNVANASDPRLQGHGGFKQKPIQEGWEGTERHHWETGVWIDCPDGKQKLVEPSIYLLAHGVSARVVKLRALGNAIVPQVAAEFIKSWYNSH